MNQYTQHRGAWQQEGARVGPSEYEEHATRTDAGINPSR